MNLNDAVRSIPISEVWKALGGMPLRGKRGQAFWRNGDALNISLDDSKGVWFDHRDGRGGGILDLVQLALNCNRSEAVEWLRQTFQLELDNKPLTRAEKRTFQGAREQAEQFLEWRELRISSLRELRNYHLDAYHCTSRLIINHGLDHPKGPVWAEACESHEERYQALDIEIDELIAIPYEKLIPLFHAERRRVAA